MKVAMVSSEMRPFAKTGGLADAVAGLSKAERKLGLDLVTFLPLYGSVDRKKFRLKNRGKYVDVNIGKKIKRGLIFEAEGGEGRNLFIGNDDYFNRKYLYGSHKGDYKDNDERFAFFSLALLEAMKLLGYSPDLIHLNDWQTALVPLYLKTRYKDDPFFKKTATIFTIHNLAYQGLFKKTTLKKLGIGAELFTMEGVEFYGKVSFMKGGIVFSDIINTVSKKYSLEIQEEEFGAGLDGLLRWRKGDIYGVINGIDHDCWNPETDKLIPHNYSISDIKGKESCKEDILKEFRFDHKDGWPLIGMVSRMVGQKGFDLLIKVLPDILKMDTRLIILGSGDAKYERLLKGLVKKHKDRLVVVIGFNDSLAHRIEAGADMFLMPSYFEPCGLNQLYSLRYGAVPIVRDVGGLTDTVEDYRFKGRGTGIKFSDYDEKSILAAIEKGLYLYQKKRVWRNIMRRGMSKDFSWDSAAGEYINLYKLAMEKEKMPK